MIYFQLRIEIKKLKVRYIWCFKNILLKNEDLFNLHYSFQNNINLVFTKELM